ncbi:protein of unknown function [Paraburkholderia kururiensis]
MFRCNSCVASEAPSPRVWPVTMARTGPTAGTPEERFVMSIRVAKRNGGDSATQQIKVQKRVQKRVQNGYSAPADSAPNHFGDNRSRSRARYRVSCVALCPHRPRDAATRRAAHVATQLPPRSATIRPRP